jgi:DNA end-binding protein Ku
MRASWSGYFKLGDLTIPVRLFSAVHSVAPHFIQLHATDHAPVARVLRCMQDGEDLEMEDIVRAVEYEGGYVELTDSEIEANDAMDRDIVVRQFSEPSHISSFYYEKPYYIVPGSGGELAYTIIRQALVQTNKVAVITYMSYEKEHIGIVSAMEGILFLQQLRFADEIIPRASIKTPTLPQPSPGYINSAIELIERYSAPFYIGDYRNQQTTALQELIERKAKGLPLKKVNKVAPQTTPEDQLMPQLRALLTKKIDTTIRH